MKKFATSLALVLAGAMSAAPVLAHDHAPSFKKFSDSHVAYGNVLDSYPIYSESRQKEVCEKVKVPVYSQNDPNQQAGNIVAGAIIGSVVGQIATGNKKGAGTGAVIGAIAGANSNQNKVVGYRYETQCHVVNVDGGIEYFEARIRLEGNIYRVRTDYQIQKGSSVKMYVHN